MIKRINLFFKLLPFLLVVLFGSCQPSMETSPWDVVDNNSVLIFESKNLPMLPDKLSQSFFTNKANTYLLIVQKSAKQELDIVYSYAIAKNSYDSMVSIRSLPDNQKITSRKFNGIEINEVKNKQSEIQLAFTYINGVFVLSKSSVLVENAARVFQNQEEKNFKTNNSELFHFPSLKSDQGDIYINSTRISEIFSGESGLLESIPVCKELKNLAVYDVKSSVGYLSLNGFSLGKNSSLGLFQKQKPVTFQVAKYIPNSSTSLVHFGVSDFNTLNSEIDSSFLNAFQIGNEIAFISSEDASKGLTAIIEYKSGFFADFAFLNAYQETYSNYLIRGVDGDALKMKFGKMFPASPFGFCTVKDNYLFLTPSLEEIKSLIDAIESDDTWGKTSDYQRFSEKGLQESNVTLIAKNPTLISGSSGTIKGYSDLIDSIGLSKVKWGSLQMSALDNHFYSTINFGLGANDVKSNENKRDVKSSLMVLPGAVKFASAVKNHNTGLNELLIQDSNNWIYLLAPKEGIIWKRQLESQLQAPLEQIDYYKNGKLQYFFSSNNKLYLIDRLGRDVSGFPKTLSSTIKYTRVVDYDKSKNYRFLNSLLNNDVYLIDKEGKNLSEWGPKKFDKAIGYAPEHFKMGGKDNFIVVLNDGSVQIFNRKGDRIKAFQVKNKEIFNGDYYLQSGMSSSNTYLNYISKEGTAIKQNLNGEILSTENLLRGKDSKYILKRITNRDGFIIFRVDTDKIVVFDQSGKIIFEKQNSGSTNFDFQCIGRGNNKLIFTFLDEEQKLIQIFDEAGNSLIQSPIESDLSPLVVFGKSGADWGVYSFTQNSVVFNALKY